jgi:hypothetical protein
MIYECQVYCHATESDLMELIGKEDEGKWLPFAFPLRLVEAVKMSTDDDESFVYKCSTVFLESGDTYIIDTKYKEFIRIWKDFVSTSEDDNLDL